MMIKKNSILVFICFVGANLLFSQNYELTFSGSGVSENIDSIFVENLFTGETVWVYENQILRLNGTSDNKLEIISNEFEIYPNPTVGFATITVYSDLSENLEILVSNLNGQVICNNNFRAQEGVNQFFIENLVAGCYSVSIINNGHTQSKKLISLTNANSGIPKITHKNHELCVLNTKKTPEQKSFVSMNYVSGQRLLFKAYSQMHKRVITHIPTESAEIVFEFIECIDYDNNSYAVVQIGEYVWMAENLRTTHYEDGTPLLYCNNNDTWRDLIEPAFQWCDNSIFFSDSISSINYHGLVYHGASVNSGTNNNKNLCPHGWYVPTYNDWLDFRTFLSTNGYNYDGTYIDQFHQSPVGKSLASTHDWEFFNYPGTVGNTDYPEYRNKTGFTASPGEDGLFTYWWSSSNYDEGVTFGTSIAAGNLNLDDYYYYNYWDMFFVRCIKE